MHMLQDADICKASYGRFKKQEYLCFIVSGYHILLAFYNK